MNPQLYKYCAFLLLTSFLLLGCQRLAYMPQPSKARLGEETQTTLDLRNLPQPREAIVVAVYKFKDQTGQYKPSDAGSNWSTAVTQGATNILIKALSDSEWFVPIERENVGNLLNERKIIRSSREQYGNPDQPTTSLPPLIYAGVILEGGIVSYDANVVSGGLGIRYFGTGGSTQYRQDRVTVYLRAVSTSNGKILKTVYTSKTILSQAVDIGVFRFVNINRLLEAETGYTYNEPSEVAVSEAIQKAVISLIVEGVEEELWALKDGTQIQHEIIQSYQKERAEIPKSDLFGNKLENRRRFLRLGLGTTTVSYSGDYANPLLKTGLQANFGYQINPKWSIDAIFGQSKFATSSGYNANITFGELEAQYRLNPLDRITLFGKTGLGLIRATQQNTSDVTGRYYPKFHLGGGIEYLLSTNFGLNTSIGYHLSFSDQVDGIAQGQYNDFYWRGNIGLNFYFGRMIEGRKFKYENTSSDYQF